jgi:hypothetical protein
MYRNTQLSTPRISNSVLEKYSNYYNNTSTSSSTYYTSSPIFYTPQTSVYRGNIDVFYSINTPRKV